MDIIRLYRDFSIEHYTEGHKHTRPGWVNTECPFCTGNPGFHLGWNINEEYFVCWRCGWHPPLKTISEILNIPKNQAYDIIEQYGINRSIVYSQPKDKKPFTFPIGTKKLLPKHRKYLIKRGFNSKRIEKLYGVKGTGPVSKLDMYDYKHRIIIPYFWNGQVVSFDSRDITDKAENKYYACPEAYEIIGRKQILYGLQEEWTDVGICLEGPTDVWNIGKYSFATSGIKYTTAQVRLMSQIFKKIWVVYDPELQAQKQARKLVSELRFRGVESDNILLDGGKDPGSLNKNEVNELLKQLL